MKFKFISNACGIFTGSDGTELLMDPWLDDGVFEGSWCHYPPLKTTHQDLAESRRYLPFISTQIIMTNVSLTTQKMSQSLF